MNRQSHAWPENVKVNGFPAELIKKLTILFLPAEIIGKVDTPQFPTKITGKKKVPGFPTKKTGQKLNPGFPTKITQKLWYSRVSRQDYREIIRFPAFPAGFPGMGSLGKLFAQANNPHEQNDPETSAGKRTSFL